MNGVRDPVTEQSIKVESSGLIWYITFDKPERHNVINNLVLRDLVRAIDDAQADAECRVIILQGSGGYFCTGMDFESVTHSNFSAAQKNTNDMDSKNEPEVHYMDLLKKISLSSKVVISLVNGVVLAGGVGIVAASDLVIATPGSQFGLSEALWGLLPACVTPYLIRRVGFHWAYRMTLTMESLNGEQAANINLVDVCSDTPEIIIRKQLVRLRRLSDETVIEIKSYFRRMWIINEQMEDFAVFEIDRLMNKPVVQENIANYVNKNQFPWSYSS